MNPEGPAQTFNYMLLGYAVILGCVAFLVISLAVRYRALKRELQMLQDLERHGKS
jgi:Zn-dependent membrane protease YugP